MPLKRSSESGAILKKWTGKLPVALVYPNVYQVGMSNLGMQHVYALANAHPDIVCERVFLPEDAQTPLSVESGRHLLDFPVFLCAVSFEQDYVNLLRLFRWAGIEPLATERRNVSPQRPETPLIIGGGVATFINPEPLAPFVDLFLLGESEPVLPTLLNCLLQRFNEGVPGVNRDQWLLDLAVSVPGCYVPHLYDMVYDQSRLVEIRIRDGAPARVKKAVLGSVDQSGHSQLLTPDTEFGDLYLTELGRGCSRGCRFCAAGFVYRPPRLWSAESIMAAFDEKPTSISRVGLLGMEMAKPEDLAKVARHLLDASCSLSFSSLRADAITPELIDLLQASKIKTSAIAPDGASERLRKVINKGITAEDVLLAANILVSGGVTNLKLYFMIGLPTETEEDLAELVSLVMMVQEKVNEIGRARGHLPMISLSINPFVPKAWTPFQFCAFAGVGPLKKKIKFLKKAFSGCHNLKLGVEKPENAFFQAVLARGDRRLAEVLLAMAEFSRNWRQQFKDHDIDPEEYTRQRTRDELFPWDIIDHGIHREYLWEEYERGLGGKQTAACQTEICRRCGVCND
ncbi:MAG: radical SAM protein [Desulfobulbaceae bacterium]|uniref:Radical SAM protein n=1 Tax=Candidatus Desulfobia pelagia TaxID=2841692 RepID=A0A8J6NH61_9BACT|nr:radical SAM protein [Candidatus Desulfobia pelagia]